MLLWYVCAGAYVYVYMWKGMWYPEVNLVSFLRSCPSCFFETDFSGTWGSPHWDRLAGQWVPGLFPSLPPPYRNYKYVSPCPASYVGSEDWIWVFMLAEQALYWPSHFPSPRTWDSNAYSTTMIAVCRICLMEVLGSSSFMAVPESLGTLFSKIGIHTFIDCIILMYPVQWILQLSSIVFTESIPRILCIQ